MKGKKEEHIVNQLKCCERIFKKSATAANDQTWDIEGDKVQATGKNNIFNNIITENFASLKKEWPIQVQQPSRTPKRVNKKRTSPWHIIVETTRETEKHYWRLQKRKDITYKGKLIKLRADFSMEALKTGRAWSEVYQALQDNNFSSRILYQQTIIQNW
jgi:hypothetical protein